MPIPEDAPLSAFNPYGRTKLLVEDMLRDLYRADPRWDIALLRYFNPVGAHPSGRIGEDPNGIPNNLVPYIAQVAVGRLPYLRVFGDTYPTADGTGVRDYIHVVEFERACGRELPYEVVARRAGDVAASFADPALAERELGWRATRTLDDICASSWKWQSANPNGFAG
jgi:UDP-glucose 4-epimerase